MQTRFEDLRLEDHALEDDAMRKGPSSSSEITNPGADGTHETKMALGSDAVGRGKAGRPIVEGDLDQSGCLARHPLSELMGEANQKQRNSVLAQLRDLDSPLTVFLVDEQVLHPWPHYVVARKLGLEIEYVHVTPADDVTLLMQLVRGEAKLGAGQRAMIAVVVTEGRWPGPGRPKNSAAVAEFSAVRERQAALAECSVRTIDAARRVYSYTRSGLSAAVHRKVLEDVMQGRTSLEQAFQHLKHGDPSSARGQTPIMTPTEELKIVRKQLDDVHTKWVADRAKIQKLEHERDQLKVTVRQQKAEIARLHAQLAGPLDRSVHSHEPGPETVGRTTS